MKSRRNPQFNKMFARLPAEIQKQAMVAYRLFRMNPFYPGLQFKEVDPVRNYWSVRVTRGYRAVGVRKTPDEIVWFWIGPHPGYEKVISE